SCRLLAYRLVDLSWLLFLFSSRRRHTRSKRDWSSDVCSSDLQPDTGSTIAMRRHIIQQAGTAPSLLTPGQATSAAGQFGSRSDPWSLNCSSSGAPNVVMDRVVQNLQREGQIADPSRDVVAPLMRDVPT